jgi:cob(I)alamin adenosyltransferase
MNDGDARDEIVRLEEQIDELADTIESCRKFILTGRIAVMAGAVVLIAILVGAIQHDRSRKKVGF